MQMDNFEYPGLTLARMLLGTSDKNILAVEGHSDKRFFTKIVDSKQTSLIPSDGRDGVTTIVKTLETDYPDRIRGICDRDFLALGHGSHTGQNILHTDKHDLEMDALFTNNFCEHLSMLVSPEKLEGKNSSCSDLISIIFNFIKTIGYFRFTNEKFSYNLSFKDYKLRKGVCFDNDFNPNLTEIIKTIVNKNGGGVLLSKIGEIENQVIEEMENNIDIFQISNGHDFVYVLKEILKDYGVGGSSKVPDLENLTNSVLGSYRKSDFERSNLGTDMNTLGLIKA